MYTIGNQLRLEIKKLDKTQEEAAKMLGVTRRTLNNWFALTEFNANTLQIVKSKLGIDLTGDVEGLKNDPLKPIIDTTSERLLSIIESQQRTIEELSRKIK